MNDQAAYAPEEFNLSWTPVKGYSVTTEGTNEFWSNLSLTATNPKQVETVNEWFNESIAYNSGVFVLPSKFGIKSMV